MSDGQEIVQDRENSSSPTAGEGEIGNGVVVPGGDANRSFVNDFSDEFEHLIQQRFSSRDATDKKIFLRDYSQWKKRLVDSFFDSLVFALILESPDLRPQLINLIQAQDIDARSSKATLSKTLERLRAGLRMGNRKCVRVWCVTYATLSHRVADKC